MNRVLNPWVHDSTSASIAFGIHFEDGGVVDETVYCGDVIKDDEMKLVELGKGAFQGDACDSDCELHYVSRIRTVVIPKVFSPSDLPNLYATV